MNYPFVIQRDKKSDDGVSQPDLPCCVSAGATVDEALAMVREAIELHLEAMIEDRGRTLASRRDQARHGSSGIKWAILDSNQ